MIPATAKDKTLMMASMASKAAAPNTEAGKKRLFSFERLQLLDSQTSPFSRKVGMCDIYVWCWFLKKREGGKEEFLAFFLSF